MPHASGRVWQKKRSTEDESCWLFFNDLPGGMSKGEALEFFATGPFLANGRVSACGYHMNQAIQGAQDVMPGVKGSHRSARTQTTSLGQCFKLLARMGKRKQRRSTELAGRVPIFENIHLGARLSLG